MTRCVRADALRLVYRHAAAESATADSVASLLPAANIPSIERPPGQLAGTLRPDDRAVLILDQTGRHASKVANMPESITELLSPPT